MQNTLKHSIILDHGISHYILSCVNLKNILGLPGSIKHTNVLKKGILNYTPLALYKNIFTTANK